jgi:hypothetical protein
MDGDLMRMKVSHFAESIIQRKDALQKGESHAYNSLLDRVTHADGACA